MTALELRRIAAAYPKQVIADAVTAGIGECPPDHSPENHVALLVLVCYWLKEPNASEHMPPPLSQETFTAIRRHLIATAN
jgi:hypothetical protein